MGLNTKEDVGVSNREVSWLDHDELFARMALDNVVKREKNLN